MSSLWYEYIVHDWFILSPESQAQDFIDHCRPILKSIYEEKFGGSERIQYHPENLSQESLVIPPRQPYGGHGGRHPRSDLDPFGTREDPLSDWKPAMPQG